jgi:tetratricopeptide (TPR) repeat protein/RNA polymerase subunit RPABC4/transcription elongation factor Spt4
MKICPQCKSVFTEEHFFCLNDGTPLTGTDAEQETIVSVRMEPPGAENVSFQGKITICSSCGLENRSNSKFCKKCGTLLPADTISAEKKIFTTDAQINFQLPRNDPPPEQAPAPFFENTVSYQQIPNQMPPRFNPPVSGPNDVVRKPEINKFVIGIVLVGLLAIVGLAWFFLRSHPMEAKLDNAISSNKLISPAGDNAYEYYQQMKKDGVKPEVLRKYEDRLFPLLTEKPPEILKTVTEPGYTEKRLDEWQDAAKMLEWASEMRPAEAQVAAKAAYCRGRVGYLSDQKDAAMESWKKAADLDKKWALPLNGIGLINNEQKNYEAAKPWLRQAIEREPGWALPYNNLGSAFYFQKRYTEAVPYYQKAIELSPRWARPHAWLASIAMETFDYPTAVAEFEKVLAPDAVGVGEMNMTSIRQQYEKAKANAAYSYQY